MWDGDSDDEKPTTQQLAANALAAYTTGRAVASARPIRDLNDDPHNSSSSSSSSSSPAPKNGMVGMDVDEEIGQGQIVAEDAVGYPADATAEVETEGNAVVVETPPQRTGRRRIRTPQVADDNADVDDTDSGASGNDVSAPAKAKPAARKSSGAASRKKSPAEKSAGKKTPPASKSKGQTKSKGRTKATSKASLSYSSKASSASSKGNSKASRTAVQSKGKGKSKAKGQSKSGSSSKARRGSSASVVVDAEESDAVAVATDSTRGDKLEIKAEIVDDHAPAEAVVAIATVAEPPKKKKAAKRSRSPASVKKKPAPVPSGPTIYDDAPDITDAEYENAEELMIQFCRVPLLAEFSRPVSLLHPEVRSRLSSLSLLPLSLLLLLLSLHYEAMLLTSASLFRWELFLLQSHTDDAFTN